MALACSPIVHVRVKFVHIFSADKWLNGLHSVNSSERTTVLVFPLFNILKDRKVGFLYLLYVMKYRRDQKHQNTNSTNNIIIYYNQSAF